MNAGRVSTLLILGGNPVYDAPADIEFAAGLAKVQNSIHLSHYYDETSSRCSWHLPRAHCFEAWGDARSYEGTVSIAQPLIEPLTPPRDSNAGGRSAIEVLGLFVHGEHISGQKLVKQTFDSQYAKATLTTRSWRQALHDGFVVGTGYQQARPDAPRAVPAVEPVQLGKDNIEVVFTSSSHTYDGRFANNGWLQETPDFMTKLTWDNAALINANTADSLGIRTGDIIRISLGNRQVEVPAFTQPGQARYSIALALGHGRTHAGRVAGSEVEGVSPTGFDIYKLRTTTAPYVATRATVATTGKTYVLASTQDHWQIDELGLEGIAKRLPTLVREAPITEYVDNPDFARGRAHEVEMPIARATTQNRGKSLWQEHRYTGAVPGTSIPMYRWGMAIDLDKCTGCNACMVACQAENNVPIVGKEQVLSTREMHWIRIDRYFAGDDIRDNPQVRHQPVACQQCETAPCEQVCPVGATIHSAEGLNDMVYNRCVGTRYCLNNCPYKVRRFNFLDYLNRPQAPGGSLEDSRNSVRKLLFNPDVTVRGRGVMEKCTFCIQRIQRQKITSKNQGRRLRDGEVVTACQQACPSDAIVFGDLNDPQSKVSAAHRTKRSYALLSEIYTKPRNLFLARIRNPNPELG
jgi:molybdopterin-containing oxidoreductase family iron-sulfur binding subunit